METINPNVSIIMSAYNAEKFIDAAIKSVLALTYDNYQLIVVDDGSTDNTRNILSKYAQESDKIKVITLKRNRGQFYARAYALQFAADLVMFQDADDELSPNIIQESVAEMAKHNVDIVYFKCNVYDVAHKVLVPGTDVSKLFPTKMEKTELYEKFAKNPCFYTLWGKLYKKCVLERAFSKINIALGNRIIMTEDYLILSALFSEGVSLVGLNSVGYTYFVHPQSVCNDRDGDKNFAKVYSFNLMKSYSQSHLADLKTKYGVELDLFVAVEHRFQLKTLQLFADLQKQLQILQVYRHGMFGTAQQTLQAWDDTFFSRVSLQDGRYVEIGGDQVVDAGEVISSKVVEIWKGKTAQQYWEAGIGFKETMELVEEIWTAREAGEDVLQETEAKYGSWYENYLKLKEEIKVE